MNAPARAAWLEQRRTGIGGSDVAAIFGLSPYKSAYELYLEKRGEAPPNEAESSAMLWGQLLEPVVRQYYSETTGRVVMQPESLIRHPKHDWMIANLDGFVADHKRIYEGKCARTDMGWGAAGSSEIPDHYTLQVQHYLCVTGYEVADVQVLIAGSDARLYEVPADRELHQLIIDSGELFWDRVIKGQAPEPDYSRESDRDLLKRLYSSTHDEIQYAGPAEESWRWVWEDAADKAKQYEDVAAGAKAHLLGVMKESAQLVFSDGKALRRKVVKRAAFQVDATEYVDARISTFKE